MFVFFLLDVGIYLCRSSIDQGKRLMISDRNLYQKHEFENLNQHEFGNLI